MTPSARFPADTCGAPVKLAPRLFPKAHRATEKSG